VDLQWISSGSPVDLRWIDYYFYNHYNNDNDNNDNYSRVRG
jgi:hypothetical protein